MISERSFEVLRAIVQDYVSTREPVGSKALLERHGFGVSSATIRNDMSILEEEGLIHARLAVCPPTAVTACSSTA